MPTKFKPSQKRGAAFAREILNVIEAEERSVRFASDAPQNRWQQSSWARLNAFQLPAGTEVEIVDPALLHRAHHWHGSDHALVFSQGLTCGSAMCFAGHAVHLAGDRMVTPVNARWAEAIGTGKASNWKRALKRARKIFSFGGPYPSLQFSADFVLTDNERVQRINERARELLGLSRAEGLQFFEANNNLSTLRLYVERMERGQHIITGRRKPGRR